VLLNRHDYISLSEQSDFYIMDFMSDDKNRQVIHDSIEYRFYNPENEPKLAMKKGI